MLEKEYAITRKIVPVSVSRQISRQESFVGVPGHLALEKTNLQVRIFWEEMTKKIQIYISQAH